MSTKSGGIDVVLAKVSILQKGRMNAVKDALMMKVQAAIPTATVIDAWRFPTYNFSSFNGVLVSVKINPSRFQKLNYGNQIIEGSGQYHTYNFSLHVLARYDPFPFGGAELESKTAYDTANAIITYLRVHQQDIDRGVLNILNITARESDPAGGAEKGAHMARIIIEGTVLAERPWRAQRDT